MSSPQDPGSQQPPPGSWTPPPPPAFDPGQAPPPPPAPGPPPHTLGEFFPRFLGAVIDNILLAVVGGVLGAIFGLDRLVDVGGFNFATRLFGDTWLGTLANAAYFTYFHATLAGQTVGNRLMGLRVVDAQTGGPVPWPRTLARWAMSLVSGYALGLGYLWMLWDPRKQTWHDMVAGTVVIQERYYPAPAGSFGRLPR